MNLDSKIYVAGHAGLVGSAIMRALQAAGYTNIVTRTHEELDLTNAAATDAFFELVKPEFVFLAAARVGGIGANSTYPASFIADNLKIALNTIDASYRNGVTKLCNLGSSCIYPRLAEQPIREDSLLTGPLEPTNEPYAIAKIAAIKLCTSYNRQYGADFISLMPTNLYGIGDNYDKENGHVLPAMIAKFDEAKRTGADSVTLWGDGSPLREFLFADDLADCAVTLMAHHSAQEIGGWINVGSGHEVAIGRLANIVRDTVFADAPERMPRVEWDTSKPNGTPRKLLDSTRVHELGWTAKTSLREGVTRAYGDYLAR